MVLLVLFGGYGSGGGIKKQIICSHWSSAHRIFLIYLCIPAMVIVPSNCFYGDNIPGVLQAATERPVMLWIWE